jgi:hypothetical protein
VWLTTAKGLMADAGVSAETLGRALNRTRDRVVRARSGRVAEPPWFYPASSRRLVSLAERGTRVVIVTTKAERFVRALLAAQNPRLAAIASDRSRAGRPVPKPVTLRRLADKYGVGADGTGLWFVEDMLETLEATATRPELPALRLFLAIGVQTRPRSASVVWGWEGQASVAFDSDESWRVSHSGRGWFLADGGGFFSLANCFYGGWFLRDLRWGVLLEWISFGVRGVVCGGFWSYCFLIILINFRDLWVLFLFCLARGRYF